MTDLIFLTATDIHISDSNPRSRVDNFKESIYDKLEQLRSASIKLKADAILLSGDLFNLKKPAHNSHALNRELVEIFSKFKCPRYMIAGNHDLFGNNLDSLSSQPLGVLFQDGTLKNLAPKINVTKKDIQGVTQEIITKKDLKVSLVGIPYIEDLDLTKLHIPPKEDCQIQICLMHVYAGPQSGSVFKERLYGYNELSKLGPDIFVLGHYHLDQGIQTVDGKTFINIGSISRGALSEENLNHHPKIGYIKICLEKGKISVITDAFPLKIKPAEEVFDLKKRETEKNEFVEIQNFVERLAEESEKGAIDPTKNIEVILKEMKLSKLVLNRTMDFIHEAGKGN
jgi:DNA repair protein SbcD/Mre11